MLQLAAIALLTRAAGWHYGVATAVAIELALVHNFVWHARWTWRDRPVRGARARAARFARYQLAKSLSLAGNLGLTAWLVTHGLPVELANAIAVGAFSLVNFLVSDHLLFPAADCPSSR